MDVHEYQAKELLASCGVAVPPGTVAFSPDQAVYAATELGGSHWVVKAQIHAGARGKAGGIKMCRTYHEVQQAARDLLGKRLVTKQTGPEGKPVQRVYVELADPYERELYLGFVLDRKLERVRVIASKHGGMEIEEIAKTDPDAILQVIVEPAVGLHALPGARAGLSARPEPEASIPAVQSILGGYRAFRDNDATMLEINPLVVTKDDQVLALDAKMSFDDNALFRRRNIIDMSDPLAVRPARGAGAEHALNYIGLDGEIGCIVNGAGLAMATMDMIKHAGGNPANFLDVGGGASAERVATAFRLVLSDANVKVVLVNIFAGINRCDWVAQGVIDAVKATNITAPLVVRLAGTNVEAGRKLLDECGINVITADSLADAAQKAVAAYRSVK